MRDPGLQPERTALARRRTALTAAAGAGLVLRDAVQSGPALLCCACFLVAACLLWRGRAVATAAALAAAASALSIVVIASGWG